MVKYPDRAVPLDQTKLGLRQYCAEVSQSRSRVALYLAVMLIAIAGLAVAAFAWPRWQNPTKAGNQWQAEEAAKGFMLAKMKSPATATFSGVTTTLLAAENDCCRYVVNGHVDAVNSFNAPIRHTFRAEVEWDRGSWSLQDVDVTVSNGDGIE